ALGRQSTVDSYDELDHVFVDYLMMGTRLYLGIVGFRAETWLDVRDRAATFQWKSSAEGTAIRWRELDRNRMECSRRVAPDIVIENDAHRYLIEIERSTKTLKMVDLKIENYMRVFSPLRTLNKATPYEQRYPDAREPILILVFESEERA